MLFAYGVAPLPDHGEVHGVALGCLDGDPGIEIEMHLFVGSKAAWDVIPEGVTTYEAFPPERG